MIARRKGRASFGHPDTARDLASCIEGGRGLVNSAMTISPIAMYSSVISVMSLAREASSERAMDLAAGLNLGARRLGRFSVECLSMRGFYQSAKETVGGGGPRAAI